MRWIRIAISRDKRGEIRISSGRELFATLGQQTRRGIIVLFVIAKNQTRESQNCMIATKGGRRQSNNFFYGYVSLKKLLDSVHVHTHAHKHPRILYFKD